MIRVEVLEQFTLVRFDELKNIQRKAKDEQGRLFVGDIFECTEDMANYLMKDNSLHKAFVKVIEIIPEEDKTVTKKTTTKKTTNSKKNVEKK